MPDNKQEMEVSINQLLETFNADDQELAAFLSDPKRYLEKLGAKNLSEISEDELRRMVQNHSDW